MPYMNCPRCRLAVRLRAAAAPMDLCPRCRARAGVEMPMYHAAAPVGILDREGAATPTPPEPQPA